ncbi:MAG: methyltransferase domain-containing protein [Tidjanibacter sp.]|nr:methyltransferase domain-containing protein [Tidjanibacter sp.]
METNEIELFYSEAFRAEVERNIGRDPLKIALDRHVVNPREVADEVKYLQRARTKLPTYWAHRAHLPQRAFEQSSSEECAAHKEFRGHTAVDLTCGLGVDTLYLAKGFDHVTAIERDPLLAEVAKRNFALMGVDNVEVVCTTAEEYVKTMAKVDLVYADPDRRNAEGKKMVCLADCSPDITALLPQLKSKSSTVVVKLSPLFDIDEALRLFGKSVEVDTVSLGGECKELLVTISDTFERPQIKASVIGRGSFVGNESRCLGSGFDGKYRYVIVPDAALRKARLSGQYFAGLGIDTFADDGYGFCNSLPSNALLGRTESIIECLPYQPKELRRKLSRTITLTRHGFTLSTKAILAALGVREGGTDRWIFAEIEHNLWAIHLKPINL